MTALTRSFRTSAAGLAVVGLVAVAAGCSKDDPAGDSGTPAPAGSPSAAAAAPSDERPAAPVDQLLLTTDETPGKGLVRTFAPDQLSKQVESLVAAQNKQAWDVPACDRINRLEVPTNHLDRDGRAESIAYGDPKDQKASHLFGVSLVPARLAEFLDRGLYSACTTSPGTDKPETVLTVATTDSPAVEGSSGFRVTSDVAVTAPDGTKAMQRTISMHGYARGTTVQVDYQAVAKDAAQNPVTPEVDKNIDAIYTAQVQKILAAS